MTTLAACVTDGTLPAAHRGVLLSPACEQLASRIALPAINSGDDARVQLVRHRAALKRANNRLDATRTCQAKQRQNFGAGARR